MNSKTKRFIVTTFISCVGAVIYAVGINRFLIPMGFFSGSLTGIAQILNNLLQGVAPGLPDLTGVLLLGINLPLLLFAFGAINRIFFVKTVFTIAAMTAALQWIPVRAVPGLTDPLTAVLIGGLIAGYGAGLSLRYGGSGGGVDIIGVLLTRKKPDFSVGKVSFGIGLIVYSYSLLTESLPVVIYSILYTFIYSKMVDYTHHQNVKRKLTIITTEEAVLEYITTRLNRGATYWDGKGAYTHTPLLVISTVMSKYEVMQLKRDIKKLDAKAFVMDDPGVSVTGTYDAHLFEA